jgi:HAD superfamily hydrolase (TIGR01457 family)
MALAERYDAFLFDLDGVLYRGDRPVPGAVDTVARLRAAGRAVVFMTNNSARTPESVAKRLREMGFEADPREVVTSAQVTAELLAGRGGGSAFVIGEEGVRTALTASGLDVLDGEPDRADHVVVGWDRGVTYDRLRRACLLVERGAGLVATNGDASYPAPDGLWPGAGALLSVITTTTGAMPEIVGKPHAPMFEAARERSGSSAPLVVGDRLDTDVAGAAALGIDSLLVLTGISGPDEIEQGSGASPTYVADDLRGLFADPEPVRRSPQSK